MNSPGVAVSMKTWSVSEKFEAGGYTFSPPTTGTSPAAATDRGTAGARTRTAYRKGQDALIRRRRSP